MSLVHTLDLRGAWDPRVRGWLTQWWARRTISTWIRASMHVLSVRGRRHEGAGSRAKRTQQRDSEVEGERAGFVAAERRRGVFSFTRSSYVARGTRRFEAGSWRVAAARGLHVGAATRARSRRPLLRAGLGSKKSQAFARQPFVGIRVVAR
ncbi:hypothetical protein BHE74_00035911 [Ensete ventricosum]|nr:hypothetical protein GW17_00033718 [Ensete ventricosum]RWW57306.1 hypothetical protein BHE74_00035911 [Ensete ventricosum]RZR94642.1 hypothetical protein BHM03_00023396 [Ensete ventricosum]